MRLSKYKLSNVCNVIFAIFDLELLYIVQYGPLVQLVERLLCTQDVKGSNPLCVHYPFLLSYEVEVTEGAVKLLAWAHVPIFMVMAMSDNGKTPVPVCRLSDRNLWQDQPVTDPIPLRVKSRVNAKVWHSGIVTVPTLIFNSVTAGSDNIAFIAQLVVQLICNQQVGGSSPSVGTIF